MTKQEFIQVMGYIAAAVGKEPTKSQIDVYWDLLNDLTLPALQLAARRAVLEGQYPVLPPVGVLRRLATEASTPPIEETTAAFVALRKAIRNYGYVQPEKAIASLPPLVASVARSIGWGEICESDNSEALRAHFFRLYEQQRMAAQRDALLPEPMRRQIEDCRSRAAQALLSATARNLPAIAP